jgi:hypothetical protein
MVLYIGPDGRLPGQYILTVGLVFLQFPGMDGIKPTNGLGKGDLKEE